MTKDLQKTVIFAKFNEQDIFSEMGRLLFSVLNTFAMNGHSINLFNKINIEELAKENRPYLRSILSIDTICMVDEVPNNTSNLFYLFDVIDKECAHKQWKRMIQIKFDIFSSYFWSSFFGNPPIILPYPMHPLQYGSNLNSRLENARQQKKRTRIFFSGDTDGYKINRVTYPEKKLTRKEIVETILDKLPDEIIYATEDLDLNKLLQGGYIRKFLIAEKKNFCVSPEIWLETISKSDFFLCPPGYIMPMCHNVTEAMAVGVIPIINYPEWLTPGLLDGVNCISFNDRTELISKIRLVLDMSETKIDKMRSNVIDYYENHLDPCKFIEKFDSRTEKKTKILLITDNYVKKNRAKLNKNSILIKNI